MIVQRLLATVSLLAGMMFVSGCASIISGRNADVAFSSNAPNTHVLVRDKHGHEVASVQAPAVVSLKRKDRFIWPARYTATFEAPGYAPLDVPIMPEVNPWVAGNVIAGGLIGLAVDNFTGAAWKPHEDSIVARMTPIQGPILTPQVAAVPPSVPRSDQPSVMPTTQASYEPTVPLSEPVNSVLPLPTSPGLQRAASVDYSEPPLGGTTISVGNTYRF